MNLQNNIRDFLALYHSFTLENAETVNLMHRVDTKYIIPAKDIIGLLYDVRHHYHVLEIASQRTGTYTSTYYDTCDLKMFYSHVTGRFPRYKVRERTYSQNGLKFFEVKQKNNTGRTAKRRISLAENNSDASRWLTQQTPFSADELLPVLINSFERITLIDNLQTERVTLDFNLHFRMPSSAESADTQVFDRVAIVELKQNKTAGSPFKEYLRSRGFRPANISKYCAGLLITGCAIGYKQYKPKYSRFIKTQYEQLV